jgi:hypothetical protein
MRVAGGVLGRALVVLAVAVLLPAVVLNGVRVAFVGPVTGAAPPPHPEARRAASRGTAYARRTLMGSPLCPNLPTDLHFAQ